MRRRARMAVDVLAALALGCSLGYTLAVGAWFGAAVSGVFLGLVLRDLWQETKAA